MKHLVNGRPVILRSLSAEELDNLVISTELRLVQVQEELDSVKGEQIRRSSDPYQLRFDLPEHHNWEGGQA